jgi:eukaryotic-like serine/threonine-protein kinase
MGEDQSASRGRLVGRYVVHDRIAAGGMATVHVGRLLGAAGFSRTVAIKRLHDAYAKDPDFVAMLLDEARLAASIRHPNVVPTLDVVAEGDELLVVMEYVEGDSVAHLTKVALGAGQRVPIPFAASIVAQALHGLHAAHEARDKKGEPLGIVHRDVSPQNILVGVDGVARVLDFGIAKAASRASATEDGQLKGKTAYMAPEQLQHGAVDRRTDIFAASVVLWELLCGRRLFVADSSPEIMSRVLTQPIDPPQMHAPELSSELAAITLRGLDRDPAGRFATAEEMAQAIEESIAMPRSKDVGAWVAATAKEILDGRAQLVQAVEQASHKMPAAQQASGTGLARAIEEAERRRENAELPTDVGQRAPSGAVAPVGPVVAVHEEGTALSTVQSTSTEVVAPPRRSRAALALALAGGASLVLALGIAFAVSRGSLAPSRGDAPPAPAAVTVTEPSASAALVVPPPPPSSAPLAASSALPAVKRPPPARPAPPPSRKACEIPYVIDAKGQKHFKPECIEN